MGLLDQLDAIEGTHACKRDIRVRSWRWNVTGGRSGSSAWVCAACAGLVRQVMDDHESEERRRHGR